MARKVKAAVSPQVEAARSYLEGVAKKMADDLYGPNGPKWGTKLTEMEDTILSVRDILANKLLALSLDRQAATSAKARPAEVQRCPDCQQPFAAAREPEPRCMTTRAGDADWNEPHEFCTRCRRAFFPSEPKSGH